MMEVTPHLKNVLKNYQHSATKSLQGPGLSLTPLKNQLPSPDIQEDEFVPSSFPIQQLPILTTADTSCCDRSETILEGETISCFIIGGEKRLCLPQVLNSVLRDFTLPQINHQCDQLQIYCSRCTPEQLNVLKQGSVLPSGAASSGLITKTDAERLCSALLYSQEVVPIKPKKGSISFTVNHKCFGKCTGVCFPELYTSKNAKCIECTECKGGFSPQHFVCHVHKQYSENRTVHWGFDSSNWKQYLRITQDQPDHEQCVKFFNEIKDRYDGKVAFPRIFAGLKRKQVFASDILKEHELPLKKQKSRNNYLHHPLVESSYNLYASLDAMYLNRCIQEFQAVNRHLSAFKPVNQNKESKVYNGLVGLNRFTSDTPVLQNPERVVLLSESQKFERTYQPNVALAPNTPPKQRYDKHVFLKEELVPHQEIKPHIFEKYERNFKPAESVKWHPAPTKNFPVKYNFEMELSTDTEDSASEASEKQILDAAQIEGLLIGTDVQIKEKIMGSFRSLLHDNEKWIRKCHAKEIKINALQTRLMEVDDSVFDVKEEKMADIGCCKETEKGNDIVNTSKKSDNSVSEKHKASVIASLECVVDESKAIIKTSSD